MVHVREENEVPKKIPVLKLPNELFKKLPKEPFKELPDKALPGKTYSFLIQILRKLTGLPWSCKRMGAQPCAS